MRVPAFPVSIPGVQVRCLSCGKVLQVPDGGTEICSCGRIVSAPEGAGDRTCSHCGVEIPLNVKNCLKCGTAAWAPAKGAKLGSAAAKSKVIATVFFLVLAAAAGYGVWRLIPRGGVEPGPAPQVGPSPEARPPAEKLPPAPAARARKPPPAEKLPLSPPARAPRVPRGQRLPAAPAARGQKPREKVDVIKERFRKAVELVKTGDPIKRKMGIDLMRGLATRAIPCMRKELETAGAEVRSAIAAAMGPIGNVSLIEDLATLMGDASSSVREAAWRSLACFGPKAGSKLRSCLRSASKHVRTGAVRAVEKAELSELRYLVLERARDPSPEVRFAVAEALGGKLWSVSVAEVLIDLLEDPDSDMAWVSHLSLARHAVEIEERLAGSLRQLSEKAALLCGMALVSVGTRVGLEELARRLGGGEELFLAPTDAVREGILLRMIDEGTRDASLVGALACLCWEPNARVRRKAVRLLGAIRDEKVYFPMVSLLASEDVGLAISCARMLAEPRGGARELRRASAGRQRQRAVLAGAVLAARKEGFRLDDLLGALSDEGLDARVKGFVAAALASAPARGVKEALSKTASDESAHPVARICAAMACCKLGLEDGHFEFLLKELRTSHLKGVEVEQVVRNQLAAANSLGELGDERAVPHLVEVLNSSEVLVKAACVEALGKIGGKRATETLLKFLVGQQPVVAEAVLSALAELGKGAVAPLRKLLRSSDAQTRLGALEAIEEIGAKEVLADVLALAGSESVPMQVRLKAARAATVLSGERVVAVGATGPSTAVTPVGPKPKPRPIVAERPLAHLSKELRECKKPADIHEYEEALEALRALFPRARNNLEKLKLTRLEDGYRAGMLLKELVLKRSADSHPRVYIDFAGRSTRAVVLSVDEERLLVRVTGGEIPLPWKELSPYRFAGIANKFVSEDSFEELWALGIYCEMVDRGEMAREARKKAAELKR